MPPSPAETLPTGHETMSSALPDARRYHRWIMRTLERQISGCQLLEIGPGYGQYTRELASRVERLVAADVSQTCLDALADLDIDRQQGDLSSSNFAETVGRGRFDTAVCLNVLEHLEDDVGALQRILEALRPGGLLLLLVPAHPQLYGPMDRYAGHFRRYTRGCLARRLREAGYCAPTLRYFNPIGGLGWWVNARFFKPSSLSDDSVNRQILLFDRYVLPISRALDPLTRRVFGQSLWAFAERPN